MWSNVGLSPNEGFLSCASLRKITHFYFLFYLLTKYSIAMVTSMEIASRLHGDWERLLGSLHVLVLFQSKDRTCLCKFMLAFLRDIHFFLN